MKKTDVFVKWRACESYLRNSILLWRSIWTLTAESGVNMYFLTLATFPLHFHVSVLTVCVSMRGRESLVLTAVTVTCRSVNASTSVG